MKNCVLGGGVTGLAAGMASGFPVYEAGAVPGGICGSYYVRPGESEHLEQTPADEGAYRFEVGGGHWIFGGDPVIRQLIGSLTRVKSYHRRSAVYFPSKALLVPYPLQNHLHYLGNDIAAKALREMLSPAPRPAMTQADWLLRTFGPTLTHLFFGPFHELYTAGLWRSAAPQDSYKSPVNLTQVRQGAFGEIDSESSGYNASFLYPEKGLDVLVRRMARDADVHCRKRVVRVDPWRREVQFEGGGGGYYELLISTLPLDEMLRLTELEVDQEPGQPTSVLVLNIGAEAGARCPAEHWIYVPENRSGFHRVGFYSNVDRSFLPRGAENRVSMYVERSCLRGRRPNAEQERIYTGSVLDELREWEWIGKADVVSPAWVEVAYTWSMPRSRWRTRAMGLLKEHGILMTGRYGKWRFQGIADSMGDGFACGSKMRSRGE